MDTLKRRSQLVRSPGDTAPARQMQAWLLLVGALAVHVIDEALTGFLDFYNPLVLSIRSQIPWFPMPTFTFGVWLTGLVFLVVVLASLVPVVRRGGIVGSFVSCLLSAIMLANSAHHLTCRCSRRAARTRGVIRWDRKRRSRLSG